ncbi:MAG: ATP-binding protein [Pseudomonadota bacterium]|nr:ATP-binding protein [Pseudomonadota bacterium]
MSLRLLAGLLVVAAAFAVPFCNLVLLEAIPPPDMTVRVRTCTETGPGAGAQAQSGDDPCIPVDRAGAFERRVRLPVPLFMRIPGLLREGGPPIGPPPGEGPSESGGAPGFDGPRPISVSFADLRAVRSHFLIVNLLSLLIVTVATILVFSLILRRPLRALHGAIGDIERGAAPPAWAVHGPAELRTVGQALVRLGAQLRSNVQEREIMLAGLSHDLRSPLARIQAAIDLRSEDDDDWRDTRRDIEEIDHIVTQCIDFARNGQDEPLSRLALDALLRRAIPDASQRGVSLQLAASEPVPMRPLSLARAVRNLIGNACVHGAPPVRVETGSDQNEVWLRVTDAGAGLDPAAWDELCKPFSRTSQARHPGGAGLGLAIVARVAAIHGGAVRPIPATGDEGFAIELRLPKQPATG